MTGTGYLFLGMLTAVVIITLFRINQTEKLVQEMHNSKIVKDKDYIKSTLSKARLMYEANENDKTFDRVTESEYQRALGDIDKMLTEVEDGMHD